MQTRRQHLLDSFGLLVVACSACRKRSRTARRDLAEIEARIGGRLGVFALDTGTERTLALRPDERFAMCSTFKWVLAAAVLERADRGELSLSDEVRFTPADLIDHAPITSKHVAAGAMAIGALAEAIVAVSDNPAANLLLPKVGGPAGLTKFVRAIGDG